MKPIPVYTGSVGLDTVHREDDIGFDRETGVTALSKAVNVKVEKSGKGRFRISRVYGYSELTAGNFHSGWRDTGDAFTGNGTALYRFLRDRTLQGVRSNLTGNRIAYTQIGDETFYSNGTQNGIVLDGVSRAWSIQTYVGPETTEVFSAAPVAKHLCSRQGRIMLNPAAEPNVIYWSKPKQPGLFSLAKDHRKFDSPVIMILDVKAGYFISTEKHTYFLRETGPNQWELEFKDKHPAIEWSEWPQKVDVSALGLEGDGVCRLWRGTTGAMAGMPDGSVVNMTEKRVESNCSSGYGASVFIPPYFIHSVGI
ncbi:MAG: hypothetical protein WC210_09145 [Candidatus Neomarinimicrobiota bacterium]|jgi:hypothetical protein